MITYDEIIETILSNEKYPGKDKRRNRELVFVRQLCFYFGHDKTKLSLSQLGIPFGKDHATVLHNIKALNDLIETDWIVREKVNHYRLIFDDCVDYKQKEFIALRHHSREIRKVLNKVT